MAGIRLQRRNGSKRRATRGAGRKASRGCGSIGTRGARIHGMLDTGHTDPPRVIETMIFDFITSHKFESEEESGLELPDLLLILVKRLAVSNLIEEELFPNLFEQSFFDKFSFSNNSIVDLSTFYLDLEHIIVEGRKVNIDKSDLSLNCLLKAKTFFKGIVCP